MARISFIPVYDDVAIGVRIMSSHLQQKGHTCQTVIFKAATMNEIKDSLDNPLCYEMVINGKLYGFNYDVNPWSEMEIELLINCLKEQKPDIIGLSTRSFVDLKLASVMESLRNAFPDTTIIAGGFGPSLNPAAYLNYVDFVVFGEGEDTIIEIADAVNNHQDLSTISNLIYSENGKLVQNFIRPLQADLDAYPFPDFFNENISFIDKNVHHHADPLIERDKDRGKWYYVLAGRGCLWKCSYCAAHLWQNRYRALNHKIKARNNRSVDNIIKELKIAKERGFENIYFVDSYLTGSRSFLLNLFRAMKKEINLTFNGQLYYHQIINFPEILDAAVDAGLIQGVVGIQHGSESFRKEIFNRNVSNEELIKAAEIYKQKGIQLNYHLIAGNGLDTEETLEESYQFVSKLPFDRDKQDSLCVPRLALFPGAEISVMMNQKNVENADAKTWEYTAMLYQLRVITDDATFKTIFSTDFFRNYPQLLRKIYHNLVSKEVETDGISVMNPMEAVEETYDAYAKCLNGQPVILWGSMGAYDRVEKLFSDTEVIAIVDNDPERQGEWVNGNQVKPPEFLRNSLDYPVFICSCRKEEIFRQIKTFFPKISLIP